MQINPLVQSDFYKQSHYGMYPIGTIKVFNNSTPRKSRIKGIHNIVVLGTQYWLLEYVIKQWNEQFFSQPWEKVEARYLRMINHTLGEGAVDTKHIKKLHDLGYMPLKVKALREGSLCPIGVPFMTVTNTVDHAYWLVNFLETILSCSTWQAATSATIAYEFKKMFDAFAMETVGNTDFTPFQGHDFSMRGMSSLETACLSGSGHLLSFVGTDTIPAIQFLEDYYGANVEKELIGTSVPASEHAVASFNIMYQSMDYDAILKEFIERTPEGYEIPNPESIDPKLIREYAFLKRYITVLHPKGICAYVGDTYNLFSVVVEILPRLKPEIMARSGGFPIDKLVIRPDSFWTDPIDCLCGYDGYHPQMDKLTDREREVVRKGLIEALWDIFGGTMSEKNYRLLDSHIGGIYGDSITLERGIAINTRLKAKGFASINWVAGIGSFTYQFNTRDTFGFAIKATYGVVNGQGFEVYKDPVSDDGMKKSACGLLQVLKCPENGFKLKDRCSAGEEENSELQVVFLDGKMTNLQTLADIRKRLWS